MAEHHPWYTVLYLQALVAIDKFMSECWALTPLVGSGVAPIVVSRWEGELDHAQLNAALEHPITLGEALENQSV